MTTPFKKMPTFEQVVESVRQLAREMGMRLKQHEEATAQQFIENNALTDNALEEINLKLAFLMTQIAVRRPLNSGLADINGKVQYEVKPAIQVYMESGRAKMVEQLEAFKREQGLSPAEGPHVPEVAADEYESLGADAAIAKSGEDITH